MKIEYVARGYTPDEQLRRYAEDKLKKVLKFLEEPVEVHATLETEKRHAIADLQVSHRYGTLQSRETAEQMLDAVNLAVAARGMPPAKYKVAHPEADLTQEETLDLIHGLERTLGKPQ